MVELFTKKYINMLKLLNFDVFQAISPSKTLSTSMYLMFCFRHIDRLQIYIFYKYIDVLENKNHIFYELLNHFAIQRRKKVNWI